MENTLENKAKFFAQYWGQNVLTRPNCGAKKWILGEEFSIQSALSKWGYDYQYFLELKPLSSITDEEAEELMRLKILSKGYIEIKSIKKESRTSDGFTFIVKYKHWADERVGFVFNGHTNPSEFYDYLRLKGYAISWMGLSVEKLIEYGWIKLKTVES